MFIRNGIALNRQAFLTAMLIGFVSGFSYAAMANSAAASSPAAPANATQQNPGQQNPGQQAAVTSR